MASIQYTYYAFDLVTNTQLGRLSLINVNYERVLNNAGTCTASIPMTDPGVIKSGQLQAIVEGKTGLIIDRNGTIVWSGIIWKAKEDSILQTLALSCGEDWSWYDHRVIDIDLPIGGALDVGYLGQDQLFVACDILNWAHGKYPLDGSGHSPSTIGVHVPVAPVSGVAMNLKIRYYEKRTVAAAIQKISTQTNGFDFSIDVAWGIVGGLRVPVKNFVISYPRRGTGSDITAPVFQFPGNILSHTLEGAGDILADVVYGLGAGNADLMMAGTAINTAMLDAGYPLLETVISYKDQVDQVLINKLTNAEMILRSNYPKNVAPEIPVLTVDASADPVLGSYTVGDTTRVRIKSTRQANGLLDSFYRIIGMKVSVPAAQMNAREKVILTLGQPFIQYAGAGY